MGANTFGEIFTVTTCGESHGPALACIIDNCPPGVEISAEMIQHDLDRRRPGSTRFGTPRNEADAVRIISGVFEGKTTGAPLAMVIRNSDQHSQDYEAIRYTPRPSHGDYAGFIRSQGCQDYRGGGHFSGRLELFAEQRCWLVFLVMVVGNPLCRPIAAAQLAGFKKCGFRSLCTFSRFIPRRHVPIVTGMRTYGHSFVIGIEFTGVGAYPYFILRRHETLVVTRIFPRETRFVRAKSYWIVQIFGAQICGNYRFVAGGATRKKHNRQGCLKEIRFIRHIRKPYFNVSKEILFILYKNKIFGRIGKHARLFSALLRKNDLMKKNTNADNGNKQKP